MEGSEIVKPRVQLRKLLRVSEKLGEFKFAVIQSRLCGAGKNSRLPSISKALL